jgi:hypothetical protein
LLDALVSSQDNEVFRHRLRDQHAIEAVSVNGRQFRKLSNVTGKNL